MSRIHGRNGIIYMNLASGGTAEPVTYLSSWSISFTVDKAEVTAFSDANKTYVAGLPDASGFYDDAKVQTFTAATDGVARKMYLYMSTSNAGQYFSGLVLPDFKVDASVSGPANISSTWAAAGPIVKTG